MSKRLRKSDIRDLNESLPIELDKKDKVVLGDGVLLVNDQLYFIDIDGWVPALPLLLKKPHLLPKVTVDMGAVRFVVNGADIMRPGIVAVEDAQEGDLVTIVDERNKKPLAVGRLKASADEIRSMDSGNVVQSLHHVDDDHWNEYSN